MFCAFSTCAQSVWANGHYVCIIPASSLPIEPVGIFRKCADYILWLCQCAYNIYEVTKSICQVFALLLTNTWVFIFSNSFSTTFYDRKIQQQKNTTQDCIPEQMFRHLIWLVVIVTDECVSYIFGAVAAWAHEPVHLAAQSQWNVVKQQMRCMLYSRCQNLSCSLCGCGEQEPRACCPHMIHSTHGSNQGKQIPLFNWPPKPKTPSSSWRGAPCWLIQHSPAA